jgi:ribonuclease Z
MPGFDVMLLGTGSPLPNNDRCGAGNVIISGDDRIVIDLGWGSARRLFSGGVMPPLIDTLCITHLHSDHITDIPDFVIMRWTGGATKPLSVIGPEGTRAMMDHFLAAMERDIHYRFAHHGEKLWQEGIKIVVTEVPATPEPRVATAIGDVTIESFEVDHFPVVPALGFRISTPDAAAVFSGDTKKCDNLTRAAANADLLVSEALCPDIFSARQERMRTVNPHAAGVMDDVPDYHITTIEVAETARDAAVKKLVLSHLIPPIPNDGPLTEAFTAGMADVYAGEIVLGKDLMRLHVGP